MDGFEPPVIPSEARDLQFGNNDSARAALRRGLVIPAHPLALNANRKLDERRQRGLTQYYLDAGAGGLAVGVHTTQFAIRDTEHGLYRPVLELAMDVARGVRERPVMVAGLVGKTAQALSEAETATSVGYDVGLLSLAAWRGESEREVLAHCRRVSQAMPLFGFYLQSAVGGRPLSYAFWREFAELEGVWAIKIAPFDRYATIDVVRAVIDSGRDDIALYTGNDDNIVADLITPFTGTRNGRPFTRFIDGGLLGQWAVWSRKAVWLLERAKAARTDPTLLPELLRFGAALTEANAAIFDVANDFAGCIAGIHEVLRREGLLDGIWCLDESEGLSPAQADEITRVMRAYPELRDPA